MDTLGPTKKCPDYQDVLILQVSLCDKAPFGAISVWIMQVSLFLSVLINRFHCKTFVSTNSIILSGLSYHSVLLNIVCCSHILLDRITISTESDKHFALWWNLCDKDSYAR